MKHSLLLVWSFIAGLLSTITNFAALFIIGFGSQNNMITENWLSIVLIILIIINLISTLLFIGKVELSIGYYKCKECGHRHRPSYKEYILAPHLGYSRYLRCPKCDKKSWNRKTLM